MNYRNQFSYDGPVGNNFDHNYNIYLTENTDSSVNLYNGKLGIFNFPTSGSSYVYNAGLKANLTKNATTGFYTLTYNDGTKYLFGSNLKVASIVDVNGNTLSFNYNTDKQLTSVVDTLGRTITYAYNADTRLQTVTDFNGRTVTLAYYTSGDSGGSANDIKSVTVTSGSESKVVNFTYSTGHNIHTLKDAKGQTYVTNIYNSDNRVTSQVYGSGTVQYNYTTTSGRVATNTVTNANGVQTKYTYDSNGNTTKREIYDTTGGGKTEYNYEYDTNARLIKTIYPRGNGITYTYDTRGNITEEREKTDANATASQSDRVTSYTYDTVYDIPLSITSPNGLVKNTTLDGSGNIIGESRVGAAHLNATPYTITSAFSYNSHGLPILKTDPEGKQTSYSYGSGQITSITEGTGANTITQSFTYSAYGNILSSTDGEGNTKTFAYTPFGLLATETSPSGIEKRYTYDANNNKTKEEVYSATGGTVGTIQYEYDILDHVNKQIASIDATHTKVSTFTYDGNGNLTTSKEASGALV